MADSPVTSFLSQDYESLIEDVTLFAVKTFPTELWTDFNASQVGTYLLRTQAYIGDLLGFQLNASVMETILMRVRRERNMRLIAQGEGYKMKSATGASTVLRVYDLPTPPNAAYPFVISSHHQFTINGMIFQPLADKTVTAGSVLNNVSDGYYTDIDVRHGEEIFEEVLGTSNARPAQRFTLQQYPVQDGTLTVAVTADGGYTEVLSFTDSTTINRHYRTFTDELGRVTIEFGNGVNGKVPVIGQTITATYRIGGGIEGRVQAGLLSWTASGSASGASPMPSAVQAASVRNLVEATGGAAKETVEQARRALPGFKRTNDRAIASTDYGDLSMLVPGVSHAKSMAGRPVLGARPIYDFIVPSGGGAPSQPLIDSVAAYLSPRKEASRTVFIQGARYVDVVVGVEGFLLPSARRSLVGGYLQTAILFQFDPDALDFSSVFAIQSLYDAIDPANIPGLHRAFIREFRVKSGWDTYVSNPPVGNGIVEYIKTGKTSAVTREWNVRFINPTPPLTCPEFRVYERINATATSVSTSTVSDDGSYFPEGEYVGWSLVPRPEDASGVTFPVTVNTPRTIEIGGLGLSTHMGVGDAFAVENLVSGGKVLKSTTTAVSVLSTMTVDSTANWVIGDQVLVTPTGLDPVRTSVVAIVDATTIQLASNITVAIGDTLEYVWTDPAGRMEFVISQGSSPFSVGDQLYVDSYALAADLVLRQSEFPVLDPSNLEIKLVGGVA